MAQVEDIKVLHIDDVPYAVDAMSDAVKTLVSLYNDWNRDEVDARSRLLQIQAAKSDLSRQIIQQVRAEKAEKAEKASTESNQAEVKS